MSVGMLDTGIFAVVVGTKAMKYFVARRIILKKKAGIESERRRKVRMLCSSDGSERSSRLSKSYLKVFVAVESKQYFSYLMISLSFTQRKCYRVYIP